MRPIISLKMRKIVSLAISVVFTLSSTANPITPNQALVKAKSFVANKPVASQKIKLAYTPEMKDGSAPLYVFNLGKKNGFVILPGDDDVEGILGYADSGEFVYEDMPDNMKAWIELCTQGMKAGKKAKSATTNNIHPTDVVEPLITTTWGQRTPYNSKCPTYRGQACPAGCTAVAMAQVMRYHQFPTESTASVIPSYTTSTYRIKLPALPITTFNWDLMPDALDSNSSQESIDEVGKLMLYCGQATDMNYAPNGSGAFTYLIPERLPKYFGYPSTMHYVYRESYDEHGWDSLLVNELKQGQPVIYTAYTNVPLGHTFICDGYDGNGLFHINWGWDGIGNGYYRISVAYATEEGLNDNIKNYHLSLRQTALVGLKKSGVDDYVAPAETFRVFSRPSLKNGREYTRSKTTTNFTVPNISLSYVNTTAKSQSLATGMGLFSETGRLVTIVAQTSAAPLASGSSKTYEVNKISFGGNITEGHYTIKAMYKPEGSSTWKPMAGTDQNYLDVNIDELNLSIIPVPKADFVVNNVKKVGDFLIVDFYNYDQAFFGPVYVRKLNSETNTTSQVSYDNISFDPNTRRTLDIYIADNVDFDIERDTFYLSVDEYDTQYFYCNVSDEDDVLLDKQIDILNLSDDSTKIVGDRILCKLTLTNNSEKDFNDVVKFSLIDTMGNIVCSYDVNAALAVGQDTTISYNIPLTTFDTKYLLTACHKRNSHTNDEYSTDYIDMVKGAIYWTAEGDIKTMYAANNFVVPEEAVAINLRNAYTSNALPNGNPNTIYMLDKTMPRGLNGKNYVRSTNVGATLALTDGYDYYIPEEMVFSSSITYQRTAPDSVNQTWSTICLPFTPERVTVDGEDVAWFKSSEDTEGSFWVMDIDSIADGKVAVQYVDSMMPYKPYLIATDSLVAGKTITFHGSKATLQPTEKEDFKSIVDDDYYWQGTYRKVNADSVYVVSDNLWKLAEENDSISAFRAYLCKNGEPLEDSLVILDVNQEQKPQFLLGDVNHDGAINVNDIMAIVNHILGMVVLDFDEEAADYDQDGNINVMDVMDIVLLILGQ